MLGDRAYTTQPDLDRAELTLHVLIGRLAPEDEYPTRVIACGDGYRLVKSKSRRFFAAWSVVEQSGRSASSSECIRSCRPAGPTSCCRAPCVSTGNSLPNVTAATQLRFRQTLKIRDKPRSIAPPDREAVACSKSGVMQPNSPKSLHVRHAIAGYPVACAVDAIVIRQRSVMS